MPFYDETLTEEQLKDMEYSHKCNECGNLLTMAWGGYWGIKGYVLRCSGNPDHSTVARKGRTAVKNNEFDYQEYIRREMELEKNVGTEGVKALATIPKQGQLTQSQAMHVLHLVYPKAPDDEVIRCAILCRDFGLHPLMKEVYLIPFNVKQKSGQHKEEWATVLGINATRKLMAKRGSYSYIDDTPRIMTEDEQKRIFGEVDTMNIVAITKLRTKDGLEAPGYGKWPKEKEPYGTDKGNTKANMAFIRSERNAFSRLSPDAIPQDVEVIDEAYAQVPDIGRVNVETGEIIEGEPVEVTEPEVIKEAKVAEVDVEQAEKDAKELWGEDEPDRPTGKDETPVTPEQTAQLIELMKSAGMSLTELGKYMNADKKWNVRKLGDLQAWQFNELCDAFSRGLA